VKYTNKFKLLLVIISVLVILSACDISKFRNEDMGQDMNLPTEQNFANVVDKGPVKGGTIKLFSTYPDTLDPIITKNIHILKYTNLVYESMVKLDKNQRPIAWLSDGWNVSQDGYKWIFHIREDVMWQDGFPLTAYDVEFTMKTILSDDSVYKFNLANISSFAAVDQNTIEIILEKPNSFTAELMTFPIIPRRFFNKSNSEDIYITKFPPGTGAYSIKLYEEDKSIKLTSSRTWWYKKIINTKDVPYISDIDIRLYKYSTEMFNAFQMRSVDVINAESGQFDRYINKPDVIAKMYPGRTFDFLAMNLSNPILKNKEIRQAIALCLDKSKIMDETILERVVPSDMPIIPESWIYGDNNPSQYLINKDEINNVINMVEDDKSDTLQQWMPINLEILVNEENSIRVKVAEKISNYLMEIGINATVRKAKWEDVLKLVNGKRYHIALLGCTVPPFPDISYLFSTPYMPYYFYTNNPIASNIAGYNNEQVNSLISRIFSESDYEIRKLLFKQMKGIIDDEVPYIGLYFYKDAVFYNRGIRGNLDPHLWNEYNGIIEWYITE
jgi:peptide/nickel transport system substrate-binding protein